MSLKKETRDEIKRYILRHIQARDDKIVPKTVDAYGVSKTTVNNYLNKLQQDGAIVRDKEKPSKFKLVNKSTVFHYNTADGLEEDRIFNAYIAPLFASFQNNVFEIWRYSFTEMMNNAIEHSEANIIDVLVSQNVLSSTVLISDDGVGIFNKIRAYFSETEHVGISLDEAVATLFAGKFTTDRDNHTGEGIFFSSRVTDQFIIYSDGKAFTHDAFDDSFFDARLTTKDCGTAVLMRLENGSGREVSEVMDMFSDVERGFFRTQLPLSHIFQNAGPVSRSEARRLASMISRFEDVTLDFSGIKTIGQGFTHELFVVFRRDHPDIHFSCVNMSKPVESMIARVQNTK